MKRFFLIASLTCSLVFAGLAAAGYSYTAGAALSPLGKLALALKG